MSQPQSSLADYEAGNDKPTAPADYEGQIGDGDMIPTVLETDGDEERCPYCGNWYSQIGVHWARSDCDHPPICSYKMQLMRGMLPGDASINRSKKNPYFHSGMANKTFLKWLSGELDWLTSDVSKMRTAVETAKLTRENLGSETNATDCVDLYRVLSRAHPQLQELADWYETGEKVFPFGWSPTPLELKMWYVSDGCFNWKQSGNCYVQFESANEQDRGATIKGALEQYGFTANQSGTHFYLTITDTADFFELIGDAPPGFEYKWAYEDRERYDRLKEQCRAKHCTQTLPSSSGDDTGQSGSDET